MPDPATVSNSSCLIALDLVGQLDLLQGLYGTVLVPVPCRTNVAPAFPNGFVSNPSRTKACPKRSSFEVRSQTPNILDGGKRTRRSRNWELGIGTRGVLWSITDGDWLGQTTRQPRDGRQQPLPKLPLLRRLP